MGTYIVNADKKCTIWVRERFEIEADSKEQAKEKILKEIGNKIFIDTDDIGMTLFECEHLADTTEEMPIEENDFQSTIKMFFADGDPIWDNELKGYQVVSPDGIVIDPDSMYATESIAEKAFEEWKKRYERQGYYSSCEGRIALEDLASKCKIIKVI